MQAVHLGVLLWPIAPAAAASNFFLRPSGSGLPESQPLDLKPLEEVLEGREPTTQEWLILWWILAALTYVLSGVFAYVVFWWFLDDTHHDDDAVMPLHDLHKGEETDDEEDDMSVKESIAATDYVVTRMSTQDVARKQVQRMMVHDRWLVDTLPDRLKMGCIGFLVLGCIITFLEATRLWHRPSCLPIRWDFRILEFAALIVAMLVTLRCAYVPQKQLYVLIAAFYFFAIPALMLPPFQWSCPELEVTCAKESSLYVREAVMHADCSLQGQTSQQVVLTMLLLLPWLMPRASLMPLMWIWIFGVYYIWTLLYQAIVNENRLFDDSFVITRTGILCFALWVAIEKKNLLQESQKDRYAADLKQNAATKHLYDILCDMLPNHVVVPMLSGKGYAESIEPVSILFIMIDDFDAKVVRQKTAMETLEFLNDKFRRMDLTCELRDVTKIETVSEEYVCCVGVSPSDQQISKEQGHQHIIANLFLAAGDILKELQTDGIKFKMGIHTGPIVAGVIGKKLPRYRLFGNTINTAARMMQKGTPGVLQFGDATRVYSERAGVQAKRGAKVVMKGLGEVMTYHFVRVDESRLDSTRSSIGFRDEVEEYSVPLEGRVTATSGSSPKSPLEQQQEELETKVRSVRARFGAAVSGGVAATGGFVQKIMHASQATRKLDKAGTVDLNQASSKMDMEFEQVSSMLAEKSAHKNREEQNSPAPGWRRFFSLKEQEDFTDEMEEAWFATFHQEEFAQDLPPSLDKHFVGLLVMTVAEAAYMWKRRTWLIPHDVVGGPARLPTFLAFRFAALAAVMALRHLVAARHWSVLHPHASQKATVATQCFVALCVFCSYDVLTTMKYVSLEDLTNADHGLESAPPEQAFSLIFMVMFFIIIRFQKSMVFHYSLIFIPFAMFIVFLSLVRRNRGVYFPTPTGQLLFVIITLSNCVLVYWEERRSRANFKARRETKGIKNSTMDILQTMLPPLVLKAMGSKTDDASLMVHQYEHATIAQSDLCGFTAFASTKSAEEVVGFLSELFGRFDEITEELGVYKVETVGDAYIAGMADRPLTLQNSPTKVVEFGLRMIRVVHQWSKERKLDPPVDCRVGVHHGTCIGGIVGSELQRYHLFGELMQVLEILESTGMKGRVQVSTACKKAIEREWEDDPDVRDDYQVTAVEFEQRAEDHLETSKGERHEYSECGGVSFLIKETTDQD